MPTFLATAFPGSSRILPLGLTELPLSGYAYSKATAQIHNRERKIFMTKGYYAVTRITDFGPYVTKLLLPLPEPAAAEAVSPDHFSVYVERMDDRGELLLLKTWLSEAVEPSRGYLNVLKAYPCDLQGEPLSSGSCIALELQYGPDSPLSAGVSAVTGQNIFVKMRFCITQTRELQGKTSAITGLIYDFPLENRSPDVEGFRNVLSSDGELLNYGWFSPRECAPGPRPLLIWLHGAGEGGTDPTVAYAANKVTNLASPRIQKLFGGAYLLAPQTRTFWMNDGSGEYGRTGTSIYVQALKATIDSFLEKHPEIDRNRVYLGGDSNGGFMTMRMILDYPGFFAAAFPVCEALYDETITEEQLQGIVSLPIWFTHAKNDPVVKPEETVVPTYQRLLRAGAKNVHFTFWDRIVDLHEGFRDREGKPLEYMGHFAWIPMLNDDCRLDYDGSPVTIDGEEVTLLSWLSRQKRQG